MTSLTIVRSIKARPEILFDTLTEPEGIRRWWGPDDGPVLIAESEPRTGGRFKVRFRMLDGSEHESRGTYLTVERPHRVVMSWRWVMGGEPLEASHESMIEITLKPVPDGTELTFTHKQLESDASRDSHEEGWSGALDKLVRVFGNEQGEIK